MFDINNKPITEGAYLVITGCKVKRDNGIYIVNTQYEKGDYCLYKVKQDGTEAKTKYNIYFLDEKRDPEKFVKIVSKEELKAAAKEVKAYINSLTAAEVVHTFTPSSVQEVAEGKYIKFKKSVTLRGHINAFSGTFAIEKVYENGGVYLHLMGKRGEKVASNMNGYYQFTPINLKFSGDTMKQFFDENYIEVLERTSKTKAEIKAEEAAQKVEQEQQKDAEQPKTIKEHCYKCACFGVDCAGHGEPWTGCVFYKKKDENEPPQIMPEPQESAEKTETTNTKTEAATKPQEATEKPETVKEYKDTITHETSAEDAPAASVEPVYYLINEEAARQSLQMWSFSDYAKGSSTSSYKKQVDRVYSLAAKVAEAKPEQAQRAYKLAERFARKYAEHINTGFQSEVNN